MKRLSTACLGLVPLFLLHGCATTAQNVNLHPRIENMGSLVKGDNEVLVQVTDARANPLLGYRGGSAKTGPLTTKDDMAKVIESVVDDCLKKKGFTISQETSSNVAVLQLELKNLDYTVSPVPPMQDNIRRKATLKATARFPGETYQKIYYQEDSQNWSCLWHTDSNESFINQILEEVISEMLQDEKLMTFLAKSK